MEERVDARGFAAVPADWQAGAATGRRPYYHAGMARPIQRAVVRMATIAALAYGAVALYMYAGQDSLIFFGHSEIVATPQARGVAYEDVWLQTDDGVRIHGWFVPAPQSRAVLLYFHGSAGNISGRLEAIMLFRRLGLDVFIVDYRGYGQSEGRPSEQGMYRDADAAWRYLVEQRGVAPGKIVVYGRSLGAGVAAHLATQRPVGVLMLEASFTSMGDIAAEVYPWLPVRWLLRYEYPVLQHVARVQAPVLVLHSRDDDLIPFAHSQRIFAAAREPKRFLEIRGGHNEGFFADRAAYAEGVGAFLRQFSE